MLMNTRIGKWAAKSARKSHPPRGFTFSISSTQIDRIICASPLVGIDERLNPDPMTVDFQRKTIRHATFGKGHHICPGAHLAQLEMRITLTEWLARIPHFEVDPGAQITMTGGIVGSMDGLPLIWPTS